MPQGYRPYPGQTYTNWNGLRHNNNSPTVELTLQQLIHIVMDIGILTNGKH